jgi:hypothetical protein
MLVFFPRLKTSSLLAMINSAALSWFLSKSFLNTAARLQFVLKG